MGDQLFFLAFGGRQPVWCSVRVVVVRFRVNVVNVRAYNRQILLRW